MGHGWQTTLGRSSWSESRSTSHHFCQKKKVILYLAASTNLKTPELSVMWSLKYQLKHLAKSQAMSARVMTMNMRRRTMQTIRGQDWGKWKKYYITTANIIDMNILKNWHHPPRIFEDFHVFHIQTSNSYLTSRFKTFEVTLYTSVNSCNVFYPNIRHMWVKWVKG